LFTKNSALDRALLLALTLAAISLSLVSSGPRTGLIAAPACRAQGRSQSYGIFGYTYHEYVERYLNTHKNPAPNLIIAINSDMSEVDVESWKTSLECIFTLVGLHIKIMNNMPFDSLSFDEGALSKWQKDHHLVTVSRSVMLLLSSKYHHRVGGVSCKQDAHA